MKKIMLLTGLEVVLLLASQANIFALDIAWQEISRGNTEIKAVLVEQDNPDTIYFGEKNSVFKTQDSGLNWKRVLSIKGKNSGINFLYSDPQDKRSIFAATGNGLFHSANCGDNWKNTFKGKNYLENYCSVLAVLHSRIFLGTRGGLFVSKDLGRSWHKEGSRLGGSQILAIFSNVKDLKSIYVTSVDGVFVSKDAGESWERIFLTLCREESNPGEEEPFENKEKEAGYSGIRYFTIDPNNPSTLYLATTAGILRSENKGKNWQKFTDYGLLSKDIALVLFSPTGDLYALTKSGVFKFQSERWFELSFNLPASKMNYLAIGNKNNVFAACDNGLFKSELQPHLDVRQANSISGYYNKEPKIDEIQEAAIKYAEVEPQKIIQWRRLAAKKALLPQVSLGLDRNTTDLWHWEGGSSTKNDDDILRRGRDSLDWDVSLNWDLSDLIWNDAQTAIDVRSRLMVELREDILDEVTKLYFERIRLKMELDNLSIEDRKKRFDKELRLLELTASLDALTGGYFSKHLKSRSQA